MLHRVFHEVIIPDPEEIAAVHHRQQTIKNVKTLFGDEPYKAMCNFDDVTPGRIGFTIEDQKSAIDVGLIRADGVFWGDIPRDQLFDTIMAEDGTVFSDNRAALRVLGDTGTRGVVEIRYSSDGDSTEYLFLEDTDSFLAN